MTDADLVKTLNKADQYDYPYRSEIDRFVGEYNENIERWTSRQAYKAMMLNEKWFWNAEKTILDLEKYRNYKGPREWFEERLRRIFE